MTTPSVGGSVEQRTPYSEQAARIVREAILAGRYEPGSRLNEVELSSGLGISRSPLREGLRKLADEGLVVLQPGRGAFVASFAPDEIRDLLELRQAIDVMAARLAAERATPDELDRMQQALEAATVAHKRTDGAAPPWTSDFHILILQSTKNRRIIERGSEVHTQLHLARFRSGSTADRAEQAHDEHQQILDAIRSGDPASADEAMRKHLVNATQHIARVVDESS
ncbi:MAG: GntR family transcriptional regulator [Nocardioidaceae bacterium]